ncbi:F-box protein At5g67140 isoform X2 [Musa acuminata AAA Group]|uniref:F-box protein At5g67140 isoform X2 n=2 Tax=Musa acuminata AAA Group TaxID=214697 RepID=UPI0031CE543E
MKGGEGAEKEAKAIELEAEIERLPVDLLAFIFSLISSFKDLAQASGVCRKWRRGVEESLARKERLSFAGWKVDDESTARVVRAAYNLKELDISRSCWGCQITDGGLYKISLTKCVGNLLSISLWGMAGITDKGVIQLVTRANSLQHLNVGGTFITDDSLYAIASSCPQIKRQRSEQGNPAAKECLPKHRDGILAANLLPWPRYKSVTLKSHSKAHVC